MKRHFQKPRIIKPRAKLQIEFNHLNIKMEASTVTVLSPDAMNNLLLFQQIRKRHERFARFQGIRFSTTNNFGLILTLTIQVLMHFNSATFIFSLIYLSTLRNLTFDDICQHFIVLITNTVASIYGISMFTNRNHLKNLLDYSRTSLH